MKKIVNLFVVAVMAMALVVNADARGFSSSSRPSSSRPSSSFSSSSRPSSGSSSSAKYTGSSPSTSTSKSWGTTPQTSTRVASKTEVARYQSAVKSGKAFSTRDAAVADFKAKNASTYTSKYASEPSVRPSHIPSSYTSNGKTYNITYNSSVGGYGYWNGGGPGLGTFMLYDAMSDAVMMNTLMSRDNYYIGDELVVEESHGVMFWFLGFTLVVVIVIVIIAFASV